MAYAHVVVLHVHNMCFQYQLVRVTRSLVLRVCFVDRCLSFCTFSVAHCMVCSCSIYEF
jgi:hypothetical protein